MAKGLKTGGRQKGSVNKVTLEIKDLAGQHGPAALKRLVHLMTAAKNEQTQAFAAEKVLERAYGKAVQTQNITVNDKRDAADWTRDELVAILDDAPEGSAGVAEAHRRLNGADKLH